MTSPPRLARSIRFALSNLGSQNAHHEFEHLSREIAKRRIASNVIPATGPVAAGGDQGRDFETFRSYLREQLPFAIGFLALAADDTVVFGCTLQNEGIATKIRSDVKAICSQGTPVDRVIYFAATNVPVATRHTLQAEAHDNHNVVLEIFDGEAIADLLTDPELFWIAEEYLHLPAELAPLPPADEPALPQWYIELRKAWQSRENPPFNLGDLLELARGMRHAAYRHEARPDLHGWVSLVEQLAENAPGRETRQRARYEIALATLSGTGDLRSADRHVRDFFAELDTVRSPSLLFDASVLLQAYEGALGRRITNVTVEVITTWLAEARSRVGSLLAEDPPVNQRAALLAAAAHLALHADITQAETPASDTLDDAETVTQAILAAVEAGDDLPTIPSDAQFVDIDAGMAYLAELVELLPQAGMFPVDMTATLFDILTPGLVDHPLYRAVRDGLDAATTRQAGGNAVADRCRRRAEALLHAGRLLDALHEFHDAKVNWWHGDTLHGSLLAMSVIADIYGRLNMPLAAKNYALAMAAGAMGSTSAEHRELVPYALFLTATYDHQTGAWITSAETTAVAALAQVNFAADPANSERYPYLQTAVKLQGFTIMAAQQHQPDLVGPLRETMEFWFGDFIDYAMNLVADEPPWSEEKWISACPDMTAPPFSDAGPQRTIMFEALGLRWKVRCDNDHFTVLAAEAFAAAAQVLLVELAAHDPVFLPGDIDVEVHLDTSADDQSWSATPGDGVRGWIVSAPPGVGNGAETDPDNAELRLLALLVDLLMANSLLPTEKFMALIETAFRAGLTHKLTAGRPYRELANLRDPDHHHPVARTSAHPLSQRVPFPSRCAAELKPPSSPGPGYTVARSAEALRNRYERLHKPLRHTLPRLLGDTRIRTVFTELRDEGWKDWHLLIALANLVIHNRVVAKHGQPTWGTAEAFQRHYLAEIQRTEQPDDPAIPADIVTREELHEALLRSLASGLHVWGLEIHAPTFAPEDLLELLANRYSYWLDDVEHENVFAWEQSL